jgi:nicotinate-nucleotide adenylyltransferase
LVNIPKPIVAIYGGSFDPPHFGHQSIVKNAIDKLDIDKLVVLPTYLNPFKSSSLADASQRLEWCKTLFQKEEKVIVSDYEITEAKSVKTSQSVRHFQKFFKVKYLIIGSDNLELLHLWHEFKWLNENIIWVIATRDSYGIHTKHLKNYKVLKINYKVSSTNIREKLELKHIDSKIKNSVKQILKGQNKMTLDQRVENIVKVLDSKKAEEIEVFNLEDADYIADRVVIANSLNLKHTQALFTHLKDELKPLGETFFHSDASDEWVVGDLGDILVHIMIPDYRQRYSLEEFLTELVENQKKIEEDPA